ncbi:acyltransferase family protein [Paractinoplanes hotanensis]|uniref:Acyltransferase n=1 Tax=Paractinoplanes hotanensis TaxID=2906497 RepID=A0ABT0Y282_9ACTN|nr:acyltransferase [Actinoplanes hotanensis]MCM4080137.1 acyltransferase [Actinoplanes hotanensis]
MRSDGLDLLRGIAVALVILRHTWPGVFTGAGVTGVVMFFALSGYLITGVLERDLARHGRVRLRRFYLRRARRLVPALVVLVTAVAVVTIVVDPFGDRALLHRTVLAALTFTGDLPFGHGSDATFHLWTLAVEEQFYLLWPVLVAVAWRRGSLTRLLVAATIVALLTCALTVAWLHTAPDAAYSLPTTWAACFLSGSAVRIHQARLCVPGWAPAVALAALAVLSMLPLRGHVLTYLLGGPVIAALTGALVLHWRRWTSVHHTALRPLVWLGTVSYGAYLWNYPLTLLLRPLGGPVAAILAISGTILAAALSWHLVERPVMRLRRRTPA